MVALLVPVKGFRHAKSRLPLSASSRAELVRAFALDTLQAALASPRVRSVTVICDQPEVADPARDLGASVLPDEGAGSLNAALRAALVHVPEPGAAAVLLGDLPCLRSQDLDVALAAMGLGEPGARGFVADAAGTGTTLLAAGTRSGLDPHFGPGSRAAHLAAGYAEVTDPLPTLRQDVDLSADLDAAIALGVGPYTTRALALLGPLRG